MVVMVVVVVLAVPVVMSPNVITPVDDLPSSSYLQFHSFSLFRANLQVPHAALDSLFPIAVGTGWNYR